jgi:iron complex transport system permease protein
LQALAVVRRHPYLTTIIVLLILSGVSIFVGVGSLSWDNPGAAQLLLVSRLPRTAAVLLTGASIAVVGVIMQLLVRNRFVEPSTTGTSEAAMLGLLAVAILAPGWPIMAKMAVASVASLMGIIGFLALTRRLPPEQPLLIPLVGLIYGGILGAAATFIAFQADMIQFLGIWMSGEFSGVIAGRYELLWVAGALAVIAYFAADQFTIAGLGRRASLSLGLAYGQVLTLGIVTVAIVSALVIVTVGMLPFSGLVIPNIVARMMGDNLRESLPVVAGMGAGLVLLSDIIGRVVRYPYEIPAGTVFGIIGAILFLWLLLGRRSYA